MMELRTELSVTLDFYKVKKEWRAGMELECMSNKYRTLGVLQGNTVMISDICIISSDHVLNIIYVLEVFCFCDKYMESYHVGKFVKIITA